MQTISILNNAPITVNGCKCVIKAELVTLRSLVIDVYVSKRRGQLVKSNWQNVWDQDWMLQECAPKDFSVFRKVIDTASLDRYADGTSVYRYVRDNFTCEKYVNLDNKNCSKELLIILS